MKNLFFVFALILSLIGGTGAQTPDSTAVIGGWNILRGISDSRVDGIAQGIADIDAEILVLTEVEPVGKWQDISRELTQSLGFPHDSMVPEQDSDLRIGLVWKPGVEVSNVRLVPGSNLNSNRHRNAIAADVKIGEFDFLLVGVHLKSGRDNGEVRTRRSQCRAIASYIESEMERLSERDVIVVGDYNMTVRDDRDNFRTLSEGTNLRYPSHFYDIDTGSHLSSSGSIGNLLDGYGISPGTRAEYVEGSLTLLHLYRKYDGWGNTQRKTYIEKMSDHLPIVARFRVR